MKSLYLLFVLCSLVISSSGLSDHTTNGLSEQLRISGTYRLTLYEYSASRLDNTASDDDWDLRYANSVCRAANISMRITFRDDGTFKAEGGYLGTSIDTELPRHTMPTLSNKFSQDGKWKIENDKLFFSDDGFLGHPISMNPWTLTIFHSDEEFPIDGLKIVGITDEKITLELVSNVDVDFGIPSKVQFIGTVVLEK